MFDLPALPDQVRESVEALDRLAEQSSRASDDGPVVWLQEEVRDKYAFDGGVEIDCGNRLALCHAACCRLRFPLSEQDLEEGVVAWDPDEPYLIATDPDGYCRHLDRATSGCTTYEHRPAPCRAFDCRRDPRIWIDFDRRIANPDLGRMSWPWKPEEPTPEGNREE